MVHTKILSNTGTSGRLSRTKRLTFTEWQHLQNQYYASLSNTKRYLIHTIPHCFVCTNAYPHQKENLTAETSTDIRSNLFRPLHMQNEYSAGRSGTATGGVGGAVSCYRRMFISETLFILWSQSINHLFDSDTRPIKTHIIHRDSKHKKLRNCTLKT